ncbi:hypothetical protein GCM10011357_36450 [Lacimicrobium alkaliphilum]|uniref:1,4-dihydroxy-2-naphthoate octaprenyltransferase n=2 Tax=Lacimicrobium alkaliphilum TaxID=1526571 RepID=A0ABQ1RT47_9ALTE|nr:hypothetical protein GCM10011357_36450 [Lacimicrobium alkaliphilum]
MCALLAHISVNCLNEYQDFRSGLDYKTTRTPFSGGSGALPEYSQAAPVVLGVAIVSLVGCIILGLHLSSGMGWFPHAFGILAVAIVLTYTSVLNKKPLLCLIAPGTGFGLIMVAGSVFVLTGRFSAVVFVVSLVPFFLVNNLLLVNQYPDCQADSEYGRCTFPSTYGFKTSNRIYALFTALAAIALLITLILVTSPGWGWALFLPLLLNIKVLTGLYTNKPQSKGFQTIMALNVIASILMPVLMGLWLIGNRW